MKFPSFGSTKFARLGYFFSVFLLFASFLGFFQPAYASQLTVRSLTLGTSAPNTSTTYTFSFKPATSGNINSFKAQLCTTPSCSTSATTLGVVTTSSTLAASQGGGGLTGSWTVNVGTDGVLKGTATGTSSSSSGSSYTMTFGNVHSPTAANTTFYALITTYSDTSYATPVDTGVVAAGTGTTVSVTATVDETLTFTVDASSVPLGTLSSGSAKYDSTLTIHAGTNATGGYVLSYLAAASLTSASNGSDVIDPMSSATTSSAGSEQFGFNLKSNTDPATTGANPSGGTGSASTGYGTLNNYKFNTAGDTIASSSNVPSATTTYTATFIANISSGTPAGAYSTSLTFLCTPTF